MVPSVVGFIYKLQSVALDQKICEAQRQQAVKQGRGQQGMRKVITTILLVLLGSLGCNSGPRSKPKVSYRVSAKENFIKGKKAFEDEDYQEAIEYFKFVKNKFPYSSYATQADLYLADCQFGRERYLEAADTYENFIKLHPKNHKVPYALFKIAKSYFERIPSDFFLFPPSYELELKETRRAVKAIERYVDRFPKGKNASEAKKMLAKGKKLLAQRVWYIMNFNMKNEKYRGALWRAEQLIKQYPDAGFSEEALMVKAKSFLALGDQSSSRKTLEELLKSYPKGDHTDEAKTMLKKIPRVSPEQGSADEAARP